MNKMEEGVSRLLFGLFIDIVEAVPSAGWIVIFKYADHAEEKSLCETA